MRIAYVGNFSQQHCTEVHLANTLENIGHDVIRLQEDRYTPDEMTNALGEIDFHLFLFTRTWGNTVKLSHLDMLRRRGIPSASYHLDLYVGLKRDGGIETDPFWRTDFVFTPDGDPKSSEVFASKGIKHYYMKPGVYKRDCYISPLPSDIANDVVFVGTGGTPDHPRQYGHPEWPYRGKLIQWLKDTYGSRFSKFGDPDPTIRNDDLNRLYANSKIVVGDSLCLNFDKPNYWSDRAYETMGRGGFLIHPYIKGMEEEFTDGENIVFYRYNDFSDTHPQGLKKLIDYYLEHVAEREKIRLAGHNFVCEHATYHNRLTQMLDIIFNSILAKQDFDTKINLGAGREPAEGWVNTDRIDLPGIQIVFDVNEYPWPFDDACASELKAIDLMEHLPPHNNIKFIEEIWRVLKPGGTAFITVPHHQSPNAMIDPTHYRGFDEKSLDYFDPTTEFGTNFGFYSEKKFNVSAVRTPNNNVEFTLRKIA